MLKTMKQWADDSTDFVQSACNLSGIVFAFERMTNDLREAGELRPDHPFVVLWVDKMDDLARSRSLAPLPCDDLDTAIVSLVAVMRRLCDEGLATDERNQHPDIQEAIRKLAFLAQTRDFDAFSKAYDAAKAVAA